MGNPLKIIGTKKDFGKVTTKGVGWALGVFGKGAKSKVMTAVNPILKEAVKQAHAVIIGRCNKWKRDFKKANKAQYHAKSEYQVDLGTTTNVDVPLPKMKAKTIAVDAIKTAKKDQESEDYSADVSRLIPEVAKLKRQVFTMQCIIAALVVLLILSWTYIALSCFKTEDSENRRKTEVDLELGEGPRSTTRIRIQTDPRHPPGSGNS